MSSVINVFISFKSVTLKCFQPITRLRHFETVRSCVLISFFDMLKAVFFKYLSVIDLRPFTVFVLLLSVYFLHMYLPLVSFHALLILCHGVLILNCVCFCFKILTSVPSGRESVLQNTYSMFPAYFLLNKVAANKALCVLISTTRINLLSGSRKQQKLNIHKKLILF